MHRARSRRAPFTALAVLAAIIASLVPASALADHTSRKARVIVRAAERHDRSAKLRDVTPQPPRRAPLGQETLVQGARKRPRPAGAAEAPSAEDPVRQKDQIGAKMPATERNFEGTNNVDGLLPPDTVGDVGPNHYMQWVNTSFTIFNKDTGAAVYGPAGGNTLWAGFGGICESNNDGDPIVLYDQLAGRWMVSQFALSFPNDFHECIAVSQTSDPTGAWYRYDFLTSNTKMNDYPKLGVWPDAYYMSVNQFDGNTYGYVGVGVAAFEREKMLLGQNARMIYIDLADSMPNAYSMLPADLDGDTPPPAGAPNPFVQFADDAWGAPADRLEVFEFDVDWNDTAATTFTAAGNVNVSPFDGDVPNIPQPGTGQTLDSLSDRLLHRLAYRNYGTHESLVVNHTVESSPSQAGVRWYEVRGVSGTPTLYQEGTYAPDSENRWMGSVAMDASGNMALGYSAGSAATYASIRYTGRLAGDPLGQMPQGEETIIAGTGAQTHSSGRWGDYSSMNIDPEDDCTFWFTSEYYQSTSATGWRTRVGSFRFPSCATGPSGELTGTVTAAAGGAAISGARVTVDGPVTASAYTGADGAYSFTRLPVGTYTVSASAYGYASSSAPGIAVAESETTTQGFSLTATDMVTLAGTVRDGGGGNWPVYATVDIVADGYATTVYTNPVTGAFSAEVAGGVEHTLTAEAIGTGYEADTATVTPTDATPPVALALPVGTACVADGYAAGPLRETFDAETAPAGWSVVDGVGNGQTWAFDDPGGRGNRTPGSGGFAVVDSDFYGETGSQDTSLVSPSVDLTGYPSVTLTFANDFRVYSGAEVADVDLSVSGGAWQNVWTYSSARRNTTEVVDVTGIAAGQADVRVRFRYQGAYEWWWQVDNVSLGACAPTAGGLVVGTITDANTGAGVIDALVGRIDGMDVAEYTFSSATLGDPNLADGFYSLALPAGTHTIASSAHKYGSAEAEAVVVAGQAVRADLALPAGQLQVSLDEDAPLLGSNGTTQLTLTVQNTGGAEAVYNVREVNAAPPVLTPTGPFAKRTRHMGPKRLNDRNSRGLHSYDPPAVAPLSAGAVTSTWASGLAAPWGIGVDTSASAIWVGNDGDNRDHKFSPDGTAAGQSIDLSSWVTDWAADIAYNPLTGMLWQVNVGGDNCIYELNPSTLVSTGQKICPGFGTSQRGLAFDPVTGTFFSGSWNDGTIHQFRTDGTILRSVSTGLAVSGLAINPVTRSLFVMTNSSMGYDVYVLDTDEDYLDPTGGFDITGLGAHEQAGLELDCNNALWAVNQTTFAVIAASSGEENACDYDIPWLSSSAASGTVAGGATETVTLTVSAAGLANGTHTAYLVVADDTPYDASIVPVTLNVDTTAPTGASVTGAAFTKVFQSTNAFSVGWSASDGGSGIASYDVQRRVISYTGSAGSWTSWKSAVTGTSSSYSAAAGYTHCFRARARDEAGNVSAFSAARCTAVPLNDRSLTASSGWSRITKTGYFLNTYSYTKKKGVTLVRSTVKGKKFALVATKCKGCGTVDVYVGSTLLKRVSLNATSTLRRQIIPLKNYTTTKSGKLTIKVYTTNKPVIIEGIGIGAI